MLLSMHEMIVWLGVGPFEAFLHSLGLTVFSLLVTLRVHEVIDPSTSWQLVFIPLYAAMVLDAYFNAILYTRMVSYSYQMKTARVFSGLYVCMVLARLGIFMYLEVEVARVLDKITTTDSLIPPILLVVLYLSLRLILLSRTVLRSP